MGRLFEKYKGGLRPEFEFLSDKAVIVQAWKKAHEYIRRHNWYSDTLELDESCIELEKLYEEIKAIFSSPMSAHEYSPEAMRLVPAPKAADKGQWEIINDKYVIPEKLDFRPLAHLAIRDQTIAVMFMMCLANIIENRQGRPAQYSDEVSNKGVSYGNRLLCSWVFDTNEKFLKSESESSLFLWGNAVTYDRYYQDYQAFVSRPGEFLARNVNKYPERHYYTVSLDLSKCYDRVNRLELLNKIRRECSCGKVDEEFHKALARMMSWKWNVKDKRLLEAYQNKLDKDSNSKDWINGIDGIPQGLVAGGFFANVYLLEFDDVLKRIVEQENQVEFNECHFKIHDYCRYVDDIRIVISLNDPINDNHKAFCDAFSDWIQGFLNARAQGQLINRSKTKIVEYNSNSPKTYVEEQVEDIKALASGPMDAECAWELLRRNRALWTSASSIHEIEYLRIGSVISPGDLSKIKEETVERFVANNWRKAYKQLKPCLPKLPTDQNNKPDLTEYEYSLEALEKATDRFCDQVFWRWVKDPSKIRILRFAFDMRPDANKLGVVLRLVWGLLENGDESRLYGYYILSELFRAAAVETGFGYKDEDTQRMLRVYQQKLGNLLKKLLSSNYDLPWYLQNQLALFAMVFRLPEVVELSAICETKLYRKVLEAANFKNGKVKTNHIPNEILLAYLASKDIDILKTVQENIIAVLNGSNTESKRRLALFLKDKELSEMGIGELETTSILLLKSDKKINLREVILSDKNPFDNEVATLRLAASLCKFIKRKKISREEFYSPENLEIKVSDWAKLSDASCSVDVRIYSVSKIKHQYDYSFMPEEWEDRNYRKMAQVGRIVRAAIVNSDEYSLICGSPLLRHSVCEETEMRAYRGIRSAPIKRKYGLYFDRMGLGGCHVAFSPWMANLLSAVLCWPGAWCDPELENIDFDGFLKKIQTRLKELSMFNRLGAETICVPVDIDLGKFDRRETPDAVNIAMVQNIYPRWGDFDKDKWQSSTESRALLSKHISDLLRMLESNFRARKNVLKKYESVNIVVFPELSVHPLDVKVLERFAIKANCMVFCGLIFPRHPIEINRRINSGIWIIPQKTMNSNGSRSTCFLLEQGKKHLTYDERALGIKEYRPIQWILRGKYEDKLLWNITASICYDATDIKFLSNIRDFVDCLIVSSSNKDINVYDAMVAAMRYHLYGHIVIANSGEFGGSTIQAPYDKPYDRVIVHSHGANQAVVSLTTLHLRDFTKKHIGRRKSKKRVRPIKTSPAGYEGRRHG